MCQSIAEGGRRCPAHQPATLGVKVYCEKYFGLTSNQLSHTFRRLRTEGSNRPAPTQEEYAHLVNKIKQATENNLDNRSLKNRINNHLNKTLEDDQLPDGPTFYAIKKMIPRARDQRRELVSMLRDYAQENNLRPIDAKRKFDRYYESAGDVPMSNVWGDNFDARTRYALTTMRDETPPRTGIDSTRRIELHPVANNVEGMDYGYDPDDGRFEMRLNDSIYAFRNVSPEFVDQIDHSPDNALAVLRALRDNEFYHYDSNEQAESDAYGRYCLDCHQYRAQSGHVCEPVTTETVIEELAEEEAYSVGAGEYDLAAARQRIRDHLEQAQNNQSQSDIPSRPAIRMTPRRRLWTSPLEDRSIMTLENDNTISGVGGGHNVVPTPSRLKQAAQQGNLVKVDFQRKLTSPSYRRDYGGTGDVVLTQKLEFYCDDVTGDVKMRMTGDPMCDCSEYQSNGNGRCRHTRSTANPDQMNNYLKKDITAYYKRVDPLAHMRREAMDGTLFLSHSRNSMVEIEGMNHYLSTPTAASLRQAQNVMETGGKVTIAREDRGLTLDYEALTGELSFESSPENLGVNVVNTLKCRSCGNEEPCSHGRMAQTYFESMLVPSGGVVISSQNRLAMLEAVENSDWQSDDEAVQSIFTTHAVGIDESYNARLDKYIEDYRAAREAIQSGESPIPYATENVTEGVCEPGRKAFGIEIEFDIAEGHNRSLAIREIGAALYDLRLTDTSEMMRWHHSARTSNPYSTWSLESDSSVDAELVSPILHDTPETWENIKQIYDILKQHGGTGSARCGLHVHMGTINRNARGAARRSTAQKNANILHFYSANEDAIRRVQTDPNRGQHRNTRYAPELSQASITNSLYYFNAGYVNLGSNHNTSVNFAFDDRIEFRGADGSLSAEHTQAQVMMNAAIVAAAERGDLPTGANYENLKHQRVGTNARRLAAIKALTPDQDELTDDQLIVSDASYRNFITTLFNTEHARKVMVGLAATTPWQR